MLSAASQANAEQAAASGRRLETVVAGIFHQAEIPMLAGSNDRSLNCGKQHSPIVYRNARYRSIYRHGARIEFKLVLGGHCYLIETKRQRVSGSTDEKLPFVYLNAKLNLAHHRFILVIDGHGWKPEARRWIERQARQLDGFDVLTVEGFKIWLSFKMRGD